MARSRGSATRADTGPDAPPRGPRPRGRPRRTDVRDGVLATARQVLAESGWDGFTLAEVSRRSGVSKPTIYRRWPSKAALLFAAVFSTTDTALPMPDTGSLNQDLKVGFRNFARQVGHPEGLVTARSILSAQVGDHDQTFWSAVLENDRGHIAATFARAAAREEPVPPLPSTALADVAIGWIVYRGVILGRPPTDREIDALVDVLLAPGGAGQGAGGASRRARKAAGSSRRGVSGR